MYCPTRSSRVTLMTWPRRTKPSRCRMPAIRNATVILPVPGLPVNGHMQGRKRGRQRHLAANTARPAAARRFRGSGFSPGTRPISSLIELRPAPRRCRPLRIPGADRPEKRQARRRRYHPKRARQMVWSSRDSPYLCKIKSTLLLKDAPSPSRRRRRSRTSDRRGGERPGGEIVRVRGRNESRRITLALRSLRAHRHASNTACCGRPIPAG